MKCILAIALLFAYVSAAPLETEFVEETYFDFSKAMEEKIASLTDRAEKEEALAASYDKNAIEASIAALNLTKDADEARAAADELTKDGNELIKEANGMRLTAADLTNKSQQRHRRARALKAAANRDETGQRAKHMATTNLKRYHENLDGLRKQRTHEIKRIETLDDEITKLTSKQRSLEREKQTSAVRIKLGMNRHQLGVLEGEKKSLKEQLAKLDLDISNQEKYAKDTKDSIAAIKHGNNAKLTSAVREGAKTAYADAKTMEAHAASLSEKADAIQKEGEQMLAEGKKQAQKADDIRATAAGQQRKETNYRNLAQQSRNAARLLRDSAEKKHEKEKRRKESRKTRRL